MQQIQKKDSTLKVLEEKITKLETAPSTAAKSREDLEEELRYITEAKNKAEKERAKLETNIEKIRQQQKEKEGDANLKVRVEILRNRFNDFIDSLD